jgi:hypothetical protein
LASRRLMTLTRSCRQNIRFVRGHSCLLDRVGWFLPLSDSGGQNTQWAINLRPWSWAYKA